MADLIDRQQAIDALNNILANYVPYLHGLTECIPLDCAVAIKALPSEQPEKTCCGYDVKELIAFAIACRRAGVDEKDMKCFAQNCESAWKVMQEEFNNAIKETLEKW